MGLPTQRHTNSKRKRRRSHLAMKLGILSHCPKCKEVIQPHTVCMNCGFYKGTQVIDVLAKLDKKERKRKEKELSSQEEGKPLDPGTLSKPSDSK